MLSSPRRPIAFSVSLDGSLSLCATQNLTLRMYCLTLAFQWTIRLVGDELTMGNRKVDVIVIGAGAAGLAAARELSQAGLTAVVIEARDRIGGRVFTVHSPEYPLPVELGAEFVHG